MSITQYHILGIKRIACTISLIARYIVGSPSQSYYIVSDDILLDVTYYLSIASSCDHSVNVISTYQDMHKGEVT